MFCTTKTIGNWLSLLREKMLQRIWHFRIDNNWIDFKVCLLEWMSNFVVEKWWGKEETWAGHVCRVWPSNEMYSDDSKWNISVNLFNKVPGNGWTKQKDQIRLVLVNFCFFSLAHYFMQPNVYYPHESRKRLQKSDNKHFSISWLSFFFNFQCNDWHLKLAVPFFQKRVTVVRQNSQTTGKMRTKFAKVLPQKGSAVNDACNYICEKIQKLWSVACAVIVHDSMNAFAGFVMNVAFVHCNVQCRLKQVSNCSCVTMNGAIRTISIWNVQHAIQHWNSMTQSKVVVSIWNNDCNQIFWSQLKSNVFLFRLRFACSIDGNRKWSGFGKRTQCGHNSKWAASQWIGDSEWVIYLLYYWRRIFFI